MEDQWKVTAEAKEKPLKSMIQGTYLIKPIIEDPVHAGISSEERQRLLARQGRTHLIPDTLHLLVRAPKPVFISGNIRPCDPLHIRTCATLASQTMYLSPYC